MKNVAQLFRNLGLNPHSALFIPSSGGQAKDSGLEIKPRDFLRLAKEHYYNLGTSNLIDALSNAKRAIDCQIDEALIIFGIKVEKNRALEGFLKLFTFDKDTPFKLKIFHALDLAPVFLISETRKLRHNLEHGYKMPKATQVRRAIDIAELFIRSVEPMVLYLFNADFYITDEEHYGEGPGESLGVSAGLYIGFDDLKKRFRVCIMGNRRSKRPIFIKNDAVEYYCLLRLMNVIDDEFEARKIFTTMFTLSAPL